MIKNLPHLALAAAACASFVAAPIAAQAAPHGNIVTLGDSYTADPDQVRNTLRDIPSGPIHDYVWGYPNQNGYSQRYVTAGIDTTTPEFTMSLHPSGAGSRYIAEQVNKNLK